MKSESELRGQQCDAGRGTNMRQQRFDAGEMNLALAKGRQKGSK